LRLGERFKGKDWESGARNYGQVTHLSRFSFLTHKTNNSMLSMTINKMPETNNLKKKRFILVYSFSLSLLGPVALGLW
jgi:hypothetical protein